jgi:hypothetical protein
VDPSNCRVKCEIGIIKVLPTMHIELELDPCAGTLRERSWTTLGQCSGNAEWKSLPTSGSFEKFFPLKIPGSKTLPVELGLEVVFEVTLTDSQLGISMKVVPCAEPDLTR